MNPFFLATLIPLFATAEMVATVARIGDGDTLTVNAGGRDTTVRLACIDAPESGQTGGSEAARRLAQLAPPGASLTMIPVDRDRYGRLVAVVFSQGINVNVKLVEEGRAIVYRRYLHNCPNSREALLRAEERAKARRIGFWSQPNCPPEQFRHGECPATVPAARNRCDPSYPSLCIPPNSPDLDCGDIPQRNFPVRGGDPHRFDRDGDGIGCEG